MLKNILNFYKKNTKYNCKQFANTNKNTLLNKYNKNKFK